MIGLGITAINATTTAIQTAWVNLTIPPAASASEFEDILNEFLDEILKPTAHGKKKRGVIIIDELDRCDEKTRTEILQGLRTYLKNKQCVYIVACAPSKIKKEYAPASFPKPVTTSSESGFDDEYLQKLFQATIWMDKQGEGNIRDYVGKLINKAGFSSQTKELVQIITLGETHNPRRAKHLLNSLRVSYQIAIEHENANRVSKGMVTGNVAFLAKLLVLRQTWPNYFSEILEYPRRLDEWTKLSYTGTTVKTNKDGEISVNLPDNLMRFLRTTDQITDSNINHFLVVTVGSSNSINSWHNTLITGLISGEENIVSEIIEKEAYSEWSRALFREMHDLEKSGNYQFLINVILTVCKLFASVPVDYKNDFANKIRDFLKNEQNQKLLKPEYAFSIIPVLVKATQPEIALNYFIQNLFESGKVNDDINYLIEIHAKELPDTVIRNIANELIGAKSNLIEILNDWPKDKKLIQTLVHPTVLHHLLSSNENEVLKITNLMEAMNSVWDIEVARKYGKLLTKNLKRQIPSLNSDSPGTTKETVKKLLDLLEVLVGRYKSCLSNTGIFQDLSLLITSKVRDDLIVKSLVIALQVEVFVERSKKDLEELLEKFKSKDAQLWHQVSTQISISKIDQENLQKFASMLKEILSERGMTDGNILRSSIHSLFEISYFDDAIKIIEKYFDPGQNRTNDSDKTIIDIIVSRSPILQECKRLDGVVFAALQMVNEYQSRKLCLEKTNELVDGLIEKYQLESCSKSLEYISSCCSGHFFSDDKVDHILGQSLFEKCFDFLTEAHKQKLAKGFYNNFSSKETHWIESTKWIAKLWLYFIPGQIKFLFEKLTHYISPSANKQERIAAVGVLILLPESREIKKIKSDEIANNLLDMYSTGGFSQEDIRKAMDSIRNRTSLDKAIAKRITQVIDPKS